MRPLSPRHHHRSKAAIRWLDRAASRLNPVLLVSAIGLGVLYVTCLLALLIRLPVVRLDACAVNPALAPAGDAGASPDRPAVPLPHFAP